MSAVTIATNDSIGILTSLLVQYGPVWMGVGLSPTAPVSGQTHLNLETSSASKDALGNNIRIPATLSSTTQVLPNDTFQASGLMTWDSSKSISEVGLFTTNGLVSYSTGTVAVAGTAVIGTGTHFSGALVGPGMRIGFGAVDPLLITTWYTIATVNSDTSITLTGTAGTIAAGSHYIIQTGSASPTGGVLFAVSVLSTPVTLNIGDTETFQLNFRYRAP